MMLDKKIIKTILTSVVVLIVLTVTFGSFGTVSAGEKGVLLNFGAVTGKVFDEGLYFKIPLIQRVIPIDVKVQKTEVTANASSKDLQVVNSKVALNFRVNPKQVADLYQNVGLSYETRLIDPALQESVKAATAMFTAEELITKRGDVRKKIENNLKEKLEKHGIIIYEFNIIDFSFSPAFNHAIEEKVTAEQRALAAKNKLEQVKFEAEQKITQAKGRAESIKVESEALKTNDKILQMRFIEKWNGKLPVVTSGGNTFLDINSLIK